MPCGDAEAATLREACAAKKRIQPVSGRLWRLVESQEQVATLGYVDSLEEQALLEELLETVKPSAPSGTEGLHDLLRAPFRYPPLPWGSRFGRRHEPGILYGGLDLETTLAEAAYYRFVFYLSMEDPPDRILRSEHTLFTARYATERGVRLQAPPCDLHREILAHPEDYRATQALGSALREAGVEAFEYPSARNRPGGLCVGLFRPEALASRNPEQRSSWLCEVHVDRVLYKRLDSLEVKAYPLARFLYRGRLPWPAH